METIPSTGELQRRFDFATREQIPHYFFHFPEWPEDRSRPALPDNVTDAPIHQHPTPLKHIQTMDGRVAHLKKRFKDNLGHVGGGRGVETAPNSDPTLDLVPHPMSDFSHVDANVYSAGDLQKIQSAIQSVRDLTDLVGRDGELAGKFRQACEPLTAAQGLIASDPAGMKRLRLIFEWTLCQVTTLFGEMNAALLDNKQRDYEDARKRYIALLKDLDDHEPETKQQPSPGQTGYGRALKWAYILPLIHDGVIKGAKVVAKWNPHISSSGIPIPHS